MVVFALPVSARTSPQNMDPVSTVDTVLCSMGLGGCAKTANPASATTTTNNASSSSSVATGASDSSSGGILNFFFGSGSSTNKQAILYGATIAKAYTVNQITLVRVARSDSVPGVLMSNDQVYEIIRGKKHLLPNLDIFFDYGFKSQEVQFITQEQLDKYQEIRYIQVSGDKTKATYFINDNGMVRRVLSQEVLESYGGRTEDIITASKKEFNFYPEIKYVYSERPYTRDIYLVDGASKKYLTPMAVKRMGVQVGDVAPVNETEFNAYSIGKPVVF